MTTFNELVEDLRKENLLDDRNFLSAQKNRAKIKSSEGLEFPDSIQLLKVSTPEILELSEKHELKLPEFSLLLPENPSEACKELPIKEVLSTLESQESFNHTKNFVQYQKRRRKTKSKKKMLKSALIVGEKYRFWLSTAAFVMEKLPENSTSIL